MIYDCAHPHAIKYSLTVNMFLSQQVATALLVADSTLTLWIPGQTLLASTSSYSSLVRSLPVQWFVPINAH